MRPQNGIKRGMKSKCPRLTLSISITFHTFHTFVVEDSPRTNKLTLNWFSLKSTTTAFKRAHRTAIKVQVHCESLGCDAERRFVILRDYACCTLLEFYL